jgi:hypothetical protein
VGETGVALEGVFVLYARTDVGFCNWGRRWKGVFNHGEVVLQVFISLGV